MNVTLSGFNFSSSLFDYGDFKIEKKSFALILFVFFLSVLFEFVLSFCVDIFICLFLNFVLFCLLFLVLVWQKTSQSIWKVPCSKLTFIGIYTFMRIYINNVRRYIHRHLLRFYVFHVGFANGRRDANHVEPKQISKTVLPQHLLSRLFVEQLLHENKILSSELASSVTSFYIRGSQPVVCVPLVEREGRPGGAR